MQPVHYPFEVECELSPNRTNIAVTPTQLEAAGVPNVPTRFCCEVWYFTVPTEAVIIEE